MMDNAQREAIQNVDRCLGAKRTVQLANLVGLLTIHNFCCYLEVEHDIDESTATAFYSAFYNNGGSHDQRSN